MWAGREASLHGPSYHAVWDFFAHEGLTFKKRLFRKAAERTVEATWKRIGRRPTSSNPKMRFAHASS